MPYEFTPEERIQNILHVLTTLKEILSTCDTKYEDIWLDCIQKQMLNLDQAVTDMKPIINIEAGKE